MQLTIRTLSLLRAAAIVMAVTLGSAPRLSGQVAPAPDSLLDRITAEAVDAGPAVSMRRATARAAQLRQRPAGALPDPMLSVGVMNLTLPRFAFRESDFTEVDVEVSQEFPWPGTLAARTRSADAVARGAVADLDAEQREARVRVAMLYYRLRYILSAQQSLARQRSLLTGAVEISTTRYATGSAPQTEPLQARVALARLDAEDAGLTEEEAGLRADLAALRGRPPSESLPVASLDSTLVLRPWRHGDSTETAESLVDHPRLVTRQAAIDAAEEMARAERLGARPDFTVMTRYGARPLGADFFSALVGIRVPLWAGRKQHRLAEAIDAEAQAARAELAGERARLDAEIAATLAQVRASEARIAVFVDRVLPAAREAVEATVRGYRVGQTDFLNLFAVEDGLYRTELELAELAAGHLTHLVMLEQLLGRGNHD